MNDLPLPVWFLEWLSVDVTSLEGGSAKLRFARFPEGEAGLLALLGVVLLLAIVVLTYLREGNVPTWRKIFMASFRGLLILAAAVIVFYPVLEVIRERELPAATLVLLDESSSMSIEDRYLGAPQDLQQTSDFLGIEESQIRRTSRADLVNQLLGADDSGYLRKLRAKNLLKVYTFSRQLESVAAPAAPGASGSPPESEPAGDGAPASGGSAAPENREAGGESTADGGPPPPPVPRVALEPDGAVTDLAGALRGAVEQQGGGLVAAIVVFSDGRITAGEGVPGVAEFLRDKKIPVYTVGVGDPSPSRNFRVTAVMASERVFAGDPANVEVRVRQKGYDQETVEIELVEEYLGTRAVEEISRPLGTMDLHFAENQTEGSVSFQVELSGLGRHRLTARIAAREEENFQDDNERTIVVEVVEQASRVLLIAGSPTWEYRFLKNLLRRDRRIFLAAWLMSADPDFPQEGNTSLKRLPTATKELFEYDVVALLDVDPRGLPAGFPELLERFVGKHRGGLLYVAGEKYSIRFLRSEFVKPIVGMLPVVADIERAESDRSRTPFHDRAWPLVPTRVASAHAATRLSSRPARNRQRWGEIDPVYWSFPVRKPKPAATVLLRHADPRRTSEGEPQPVMAWHFYEGGRVIFLGTDESWRWRATTLEVYDQFWIQTVRYLTESRLSGGRRQILQTDSEEYDLGDVVRVSALLLDENYKPRVIDSQTVTIDDPEGAATEVELEPDSSAPGWFRGIFVPRGLGEHTIRLPDGTERVVRVEPPDLEFQEPRLEEATLRSLAERTEGKYYRLWEAPAVLDEIGEGRQTVTTADEPIPLWDNWFSLGLLAGLLTMEWILRKLNRLL
ncbi:MAG: hypothetical protein O7J95_16735 [Planctomycetota bacterium]|nr:hypothetical protein [Planctomycetota bacterium]